MAKAHSFIEDNKEYFLEKYKLIDEVIYERMDGTINKQGYRDLQTKGKKLKYHRIIFFIQNGYLQFTKGSS